MISAHCGLLVQAKGRFLTLWDAFHRGLKEAVRRSIRDRWNALKEFSNNLLLLQLTTAAYHFVVDFSLSELVYESPEENELCKVGLSYTKVQGERLWKNTCLGGDQGPWKGLEAQGGDRTCRCRAVSCSPGKYSLCWTCRLSLVPVSLGHCHAHCIVWGTFGPQRWMWWNYTNFSAWNGGSLVLDKVCWPSGLCYLTSQWIVCIKDPLHVSRHPWCLL